MTERESGSGQHVVVAGAGFAGLGAAYMLRQRMGEQATVTVVSPSPHFIFAPSLIWTPFGRTTQQSLFDIQPALAEQGIRFVRSPVHEVRIYDNQVVLDDGELRYDRLLVATGGTPDSRAIPGLTGEFREAAWVVGEESAMDLRNLLQRLTGSPGPLVVGVAQGASYVSAAYEFAMLIDTQLRRVGVRDRIPITFITSEPALGDFGYGQTAAETVLAEIFDERDIAVRTGVAIERVSRREVTLGNGESLEAEAAIIMPPFTGAVDIWKSAGLTDETGLIPVDEHYRHTQDVSIYAAGVASYFVNPVPPLGRKHAPQTGYLSFRMGIIAGENIAASLGYGGPSARTLPRLVDIRVLDGGEDGVVIVSRGDHDLHNTARRVSGAKGHELKEAIERHLLWRLSTGRVASFATSEQPTQAGQSSAG